jgi:hypothetical protein
MRGRLAVECHYSQEYISEMELPDVFRMAAFWLLEPPVSRLLAMRYGYKSKPDEEAVKVTPRNVTPFEKLPPWLRKAMIKKSGKTEAEYLEALKVKRTADYHERLAEIRKKKANG